MLDLWGVLILGQSFLKKPLIHESPGPANLLRLCSAEKTAASAKSSAMFQGGPIGFFFNAHGMEDTDQCCKVIAAM